MTQPGLCKICSTKPLACSKCGDAAKKGQKRTLADFNLDEILRKKRTKELRRARCKQCEADAPIRATKAAKCKQCGHWKSRSHVTGLDSETNEGICRTCATRNAKPPAQPPAKACQQCGNGLPKYATPGTWCDSCAFPPCQGGCGHARPRKSAYHAKNRPTWVCNRCAAKKCSQCGGDLLQTANADSWCESCAFPPCQGGCGQARPRKGECRARVCPNWTCNQCAANTCSQCGGSLARTADADSWCNNCAFPPCQGGCGRARPRRDEYRARRWPYWVCCECARKPSETPGQKRHKRG